MSFQERSIDEREAACIVAGLHSNTNTTSMIGVAASTAAAAAAAGTKRSRSDNTDEKGRSKKKTAAAASASKKAAAAAKLKKEPPMDATGLVFAQPELKPPPYFYYTDHSLEQDDDPLTPITAAGSVPTFPAKMHAILTNPELADVVGWAPHGRSWRILKPRDFEIRVLPKYFEHSKFSSFVRQANGWGFRRMSQGYDKNAYYHEYFLRAMPWLCKKMRRPKVAEKKAVDPEMEPDLDSISFQFAVPDRPPTREVLVLQKTIELGPKARMPVLWDTGTPPAAPSSPVRVPNAPAVDNAAKVENLPNLNHSASYGDLKPAALPTPPPVTAAPAQLQGAAGPAATSTMMGMGNNMGNYVQNNGQQFAQNTMLPPNSMPTSNQNNFNTNFAYAAAASAPPTNLAPPSNYPPSNTNEAPPSSSLGTDSHFAAGFMAATAYHSNQIRNMLSSAFVAGMPIPNNGSMVMPSAAAVTTANLGNAFDLLQRAGMGNAGMGNHTNFHPQSYAQGNTSVAPAAAAAAAGVGGNSQPNSLSDQAMQRLQQFQVHQANNAGDAPQFSFPPRYS